MRTQHEDYALVVEALYARTMANDPIELAGMLGITIKTEDLPVALLGMYTEIGKRNFIVLNDVDDDDMQRYVVALCLYYHLRGEARFLSRSGPVDGNYAAVHFAYALLTCRQDRPDPCPEGYEAFERACGIPEEVIQMSKRRLN